VLKKVINQKRQRALFLFNMQYNSHADSQDIVSLANDLASTDNTVYPLAQKTRAANKSMRSIWNWIFEAYGGWVYDDSNNTDFPVATTTITANQQDYSIPSEALEVTDLEVKDSSGNWHDLAAITKEEIDKLQAENEFYKTAGLPLYYMLIAGSFKLFPKSDYTQTASLRCSFTRGVTSFASTDTTKTPGFVSQFHEAVATGMALEWAKDKGITQLQQSLFGDWINYEKAIKKFYSERYYEKYPKRIQVIDEVRVNM